MHVVGVRSRPVADPKLEGRQHVRARARPGRIVLIRYRVTTAPSPGDWIVAETRDIGVGGAFIAEPRPLAVGTTIDVEVALPGSERTLKVPATVRWTSTDPERTGMGVQFLQVDFDVLIELSELFGT